MWTLLLGAAAAAAYFYLWDSRAGPRRRAAVRDRLAGLPGMARAGGPAAAGAAPAAADAGHPGDRGDAGRDTEELARSVAAHAAAGTWAGDDAELAQKVRSEVFEALGVPRGGISVNAERGVVVLRGQAGTAEEIAALEAAVRRVAGVRDVDNRLHLPGAPAP